MRFKKTDKNTGKKAEKAKKSSAKSAAGISGKTVIGLDIGQNNIRMIQLSGKGGNQVQVDKYAIEPLPQGVISGTEITNFDTLVSQLQHCYGKLKTGCKSVNLALPMGSVTIETNLQFSPDSELTIQELVEAEVVRVGALDEMRYDWQMLPHQGASPEEPVLMVAAKTENVDRYVDLVEDAGLTVTNVDVDVFALFNAYAYVNEMHDNEFFQERVALFDIGDVVMKALVVEGGKILYRHESNFGLDQLVQLIQRTYQTTEEEALEMIAGRRQRPEEYKVEVSDYFNMLVAQEVQRVMNFFMATRSQSDSSIQCIFLSGSGCVAHSGLVEVVRLQTEIPTQELAPVLSANIKAKVSDEQLEEDANGLTTAFGLALRGLF
ncbi:type IV pilus biogenesis protein PilM [Conchiformibius steedae]|uniref:Type IV pilus assembly protein PilM n=1 Tax=Conchiformibius steedae TaxID=153493 RepID=A0A3P2A7E7_9NEIS|nr:type IV pilus assembly protein PilM [Conchiformibius steedae]RRD91294.1 type IV pilus assembly protein PilM [Conchiformibius steedae]